MTNRPTIRGLLDFRSDEPSSTANPKEETREYVEVDKADLAELEKWAALGIAFLKREELRRKLAPKKGRPKKHPLASDDVRRALAAWDFINNTRHRLGRPNLMMTNREIIRLLKLLENETKTPSSERLFGADEVSLEGSVSRGRTLLKIDEFWNSDVCAKLMNNLS